MTREMKDSGIEWIGQIPSTWQVLPQKYVMHKVKNLCEHYDGQDIISLSMQGVHVRDLDAGGKMPTTFDGYQFVEPEDMLLCLFDIDVTPRCVGIVHDYGLTSPAYSRFKMHDGYLNRYFDYLLRFIDDEKVFVHLSKNLRSSLTETDFGSIKTVAPPVEEQDLIAGYLDRKCAEIDSVIAATQRTIEEYKVLKQSIITDAVTKGVRGKRPMKDSGIELVDVIPEEWRYSPIKYVAKFQPACNTSDFTEDTEITYTPMDCIKNGYYVQNTAKYGSVASSLTPYEEGDIVMAKVTPCFENGNIALMENLASGFGMGSSELFVYRAIDVNVRFLLYWLQNDKFKDGACATMTGTGGLKRVSPYYAKNAMILLPSDDEQEEIVAYLDAKCADMDSLIASKEKLLTELESYKKSVIYEYVTGKKGGACMPVNDTTEKRFESDIESFFLSAAGGYTKCEDEYDPKLGLYTDTLIRFIQDTQPKSWQRFVNMNAVDPVRKFCVAFNNACDMDGILDVLRHGFKHRGIPFKVCYFMPESTLNETDKENYQKNIFHCIRQWHYSSDNKNSVDMLLTVNGIPVFAFELKNQFTGQSVENAKRQWMSDRDPREICFQFNKRILAYFCVDLNQAWMTTKLDGDKTFFLPFNQGSNGAGNDGGKGNPANPDGYPTDYLWKNVFQADSMMDIIQKFISLQGDRLIFPRFHQLDVVRKLIADVRENGAGRNYLIQHSAGSGKSNSIAWTAYRLASLHDSENRAIFSSVIVVTDRTVLDAQLQATISGFDHTLGSVETIGEGKNSQDLKRALNDGVRIIVTTLQKFPVIYEEVDEANGRNFAIICDEAHSSQTGSSAQKLKTALADIGPALKEYAEIEGIAEEKVDPQDKLVKELIAHGKHHNLSFFAFTATPKDTTLEMFGQQAPDGSFHPFHIYSMHQAIEEGFILDVLQNYMTYKTCFKIAKNAPDNPEVPASSASKVIKKYQQLHPENIRQKSEIIVETFRSTTRTKINGKGKMMVVTASRPAAVLYFLEIKRYAAEMGYDDVKPMVAFSGEVTLNDETYTESGLNVRPDGSHITEAQTKQEFHDNFNILIVAEKYQTGFDEPLLHTMIVDKKLRSVKTVQTLSRLNRTCRGKNDTFVLDFANEKDDVQADFQVFYHETMLEEEVNTDLLYKVEKQLRSFRIYDDLDINGFCEVYFAKGAQSSDAQGLLVSKLVPAVQRYQEKERDDRYQIRRTMRNFCKWYKYVSQVVRMFDKELHREFVYCSFLVGMLQEEVVVMDNIAKLLTLEMYKLEKTFDGDISLGDEIGTYEPAEPKGASKPEEKDPLDEIIERINEKYKGDFTEADKVMIGALAEKLRGDSKLTNMALSSDPRVFAESIFPQAFNIAAQDSYMESQETYTSLFEDTSKYNAIMSTLADMLYHEMRLPSGKK